MVSLGLLLPGSCRSDLCSSTQTAWQSQFDVFSFRESVERRHLLHLEWTVALVRRGDLAADGECLDVA
jgi:hypothetical protein